MELNGKRVVSAEFVADTKHPQIHIHVDDGSVHAMDPAAIASWSELLGYDDPAETLEAILQARVNRSEPEPDDENGGENVWTEPYILLGHRERAREDEYEKAVYEGARDDPRSPRLRSTIAAHNAVHRPVDDGECAMDRCRRASRDRMVLPEPSKKCGADSRVRDKVTGSDRVLGTGIGPGAKAVVEDVDPDRQKLREVVDQFADLIQPNIKEFLHSTTGNAVDPMKEPEPEPPTREEEADAVMEKYGGQRVARRGDK